MLICPRQKHALVAITWGITHSTRFTYEKTNNRRLIDHATVICISDNPYHHNPPISNRKHARLNASVPPAVLQRLRPTFRDLR